MSKEKVLVLDIDGTLTNSRKEITEETKKAIWNVLDRGHKVILASGRPTPGMRRYEKELELKEQGGYLLSYNGAKIIECKTNKVIYEKTLPLSLVGKLFEYAKKEKIGLVTYEDEIIISAFEQDIYSKKEADINGLETKIVEDFVSYIDFNINKCLLTAPPEKAEICEKEIQELLGNEASVYRSEPFFIEVMPQNVDKASSLDKMLATIGLTKEDAICCGDGYNDISMIQYAGVGVAMGNAQVAVKEVADYITKTNDEDGLVQVMEAFLLN